MNPFWTTIILRTTLRKRALSDGATSFSRYALAKGYRELGLFVRRATKDILLIVAGIFSAAFGFKGFLLTNNFIDGGATGISLLLAEVTLMPLWLLIICINVPFIALGYRVMGKAFAIKTTLAIAGLATCLALVEFPDITQDNILVAVFGGFFLGAGIGLAMRGGGVIDGTEVLAIYLSRKLGTTVGDIIILINVLIFGTAAYLLGVDNALYSMITYLAASRTLDFLIEGIEEYIGVTIVSSHHEEIREMVVQKLGRGVTTYNGKRNYGKKGESKQTDILFTVITRLELNRLNTEIEKITPDAFIVMHAIKDTKGGMIKKRPLH